MELNYNALDDLLEDDFFENMTEEDLYELLDELDIYIKE